MTMDRRNYLILTGGGLTVLAGCVGGGEEDIKDSDGDGVIDSKDYAPNDPEVQEKSDLQKTDTVTPAATPATTTTTTTPTTKTTPSTKTTTKTTTTITTTPKPTGESNDLVVDDSYYKDTSRIESYNSEEVSVYVHPKKPTTDFEEVKLVGVVQKFPRESIMDETLSSPFTRNDNAVTRTLELDLSDLETVPKNWNEDKPKPRYSIFVGLAPSSATEGDIPYEKVTTIMESDPFVLRPDRVTLKRDGYPESLDDDSGDGYSRNEVEGAYHLEIDGRTQGENWSVWVNVYKSAHANAVRKSRGRLRPEYVDYELTDGSANELASLLKDIATNDLNYEGFAAVEFVIDFVQQLPYVPDDVSKGFDDYTKFIMETLPEMGGDCEDSAIMLASILQAEAFYYDMVLIQPPGHMAAGIWSEDPSGFYYEYEGRKYEYIETTGTGWGIGDMPDDYEGESATIYQV